MHSAGKYIAHGSQRILKTTKERLQFIKKLDATEMKKRKVCQRSKTICKDQKMEIIMDRGAEERLEVLSVQHRSRL